VGGRRVILALAAMLLLTACSPKSTGAATPSATVATEPARTTTTGPYDIPPVIDAAYVNRVLAGLDAVYGDVTRMVVSTKRLPPEALARLRAIYDDPGVLQLKIDAIQTVGLTQLSQLRSNPGNQLTMIGNLITVRPNCVFASVTRDFTQVVPNASGVDHLWVALVPLNPVQDPNHYNLTAWAYRYEGFPPSRTQPTDPCAA
jgi:hypothetical protein